MKDIEKFVWLLIVLAIVSAIFPIVRDLYLASTYGNTEIPKIVKYNFRSLSLLFIGLQNVGAALWLNYLAKKHEVSRLAWVFFGLFFGLFAIGIYYLVWLNEKNET